ncbi:MAG: hypothetical protein GY827_01670, partial [Cytophagales bacterium]|nr:hypothetical protein [Cytophagales bacterium]
VVSTPQKEKTNQKEKELQQLSQSLEQRIEELEDEKRVSLKDLSKLKKRIETLESLLIANNISTDSTITEQEASIVVKQQLEALKQKVKEKEEEVIRVKEQRRSLLYSLLFVVFFCIPSILAIIFYRNNKKTQQLNIEVI